jgi:hypothetical protein
LERWVVHPGITGVRFTEGVHSIVYGRAVKGKRRGISDAEQEKYVGRLEMISDAEK